MYIFTADVKIIEYNCEEISTMEESSYSLKYYKLKTANWLIYI